MAEKPKSGLKKEGGSAAFKQGEEKVLVIPLRREFRKSPRNTRKNRSVREIKSFLSRHMKVAPSDIRISQQLNESLWKGGLHNNQAKIKIKISADEEGMVFARLMDEREKPKKERKSRLGLRERLTRRRETAKEGKPKEEKPAENKEQEPKKEEPAKEKKPEPLKEPAKEEAPEEFFEEDMK